MLKFDIGKEIRNLIITEIKKIKGEQIMIKSNIQGRHITHNYDVKYEHDEKGELKYKPFIEKRDDVRYETILTVDGEIGRNTIPYPYSFGLALTSDKINISEDEEIAVTKKIYRADLHEYMIRTDKILSEIHAFKEDAEDRLAELIAEYNKQMIEKDEKLSTYCKVHKLTSADTDYEDLKKIVYNTCCINKNNTITTQLDFDNYTLVASNLNGVSMIKGEN